MKRSLIILVAFALLLSSASQLNAGVSDAAVLFLRIAAGARAAGMGEAFVAVADDATTTHWNPAGLGMYPLASEYHTFKLDYNPHITDLALKILEGDMEKGTLEVYKNFEFRPDGIYKKTNEADISYEEFTVDRDQSILYYIISNVNTTERDMLKLAVRAVAKENSGVSFQDINKERLRLIDYYKKDSEREDQINERFEKLLASWQELKVKESAIKFIDEKITFALSDSEITEKEYGEIMMAVDKAPLSSRSEAVKVPYTVLLSLWKDYASPWSKNITSMALVENGLPEANYKKYDIWALSSSGLLHFDGQQWLEGMVLRPKRSATLEDVVYEQLSAETPEQVEDKKMALAEANNDVSWDHLNKIIDSLKARLPEGEGDNLIESLEFLKSGWLNLTLNQPRLTDFVNQAQAALEQEDLPSETIDRLSFLAARADYRRLPEKIVIPFTLALDAAPKVIAGMGNYLWVGTDDGLYRYDARRKQWKKYTSEGGLPDNTITSLSTYDDNSIWVSTKTGIAFYNRESWTSYSQEEGIKDSALYLVYAAARNKVWAVSNNNFYTFNGSEWQDYFIYETAVNDTISKIVRDFVGYSDPNAFANAEYQIKLINSLQGDIPEPGQKLKIPFSFSMPHKINNMVYDSRGRLWIGTDYGVKIFYDGKFNLFGYKPYEVKEEMAVEEIAADFLKTDNQAKIDQLSSRIRDFNKITTNKIPAGKVVYIYSNPLGSKIHSLMADGSTVYIGTQHGLVEFKDDQFGYFYQEGLEKQKAIAMKSRGGEKWFATANKIVIFADAMTEVTLMHANWLPELANDIYYEFLSYTQHLGEEWGTYGFSATFLSYGTLVRVDEFNNIMGTFNSFDMAMSFSYGKKMSNNMAAGLSAKWIYSRLSDQGAGREIGSGNGSSLGIDIGLLYKPTKRLALGATISNLGPDISYIDAAQSDPIPRNLAVGLSYKLIDNPYNRLMLVGEINKMLTGLSDGFSTELKEAIENVGFEYWYGSFIAFRAGYIYDRVGAVKTPTLGAGIRYKGFTFDFAYIPSSSTVPLSNTVRYSLTAMW
jgi:hypothetical protein